MSGALKELWKEANSPLDFIVVIWIYGLMGLFGIGMISLLYGIITGQADISNMTFGIFDTLG
jgi:hypothetical protein